MDLKQVAEKLQELAKGRDDIKVELVGKWIWISGEGTKGIKKQLSEMKCYYASQKKMWYYREPQAGSYKKKNAWDMWKIRQTFGSQELKAVEG